jgi:hypothetical protein
VRNLEELLDRQANDERPGIATARRVGPRGS